MLASSRPRYTTSINILSSGLSFTTAGTSSTLCGTPAVHDKSLFITMIQCINCTYLPNSHKSSISSDLFTCYRTLVNFSHILSWIKNFVGSLLIIKCFFRPNQHIVNHHASLFYKYENQKCHDLIVTILGILQFRCFT